MKVKIKTYRFQVGGTSRVTGKDYDEVVNKFLANLNADQVIDIKTDVVLTMFNELNRSFYGERVITIIYKEEE